MKVLNNDQIQSVSGAGVLADGLGAIGATTGMVLQFTGWRNAKVNLESFAKNTGLAIESALGAAGSFIKFLTRS